MIAADIGTQYGACVQYIHRDLIRALAEKLYGAAGKNFPVLGEGMDTDWMADAGRFRETTGIREPFLLYAASVCLPRAFCLCFLVHKAGERGCLMERQVAD